MAIAMDYTITQSIEGSSRLVNGFGRNPNADGSDEDEPPLNPPHPRLTGLGKCHKFPYRCVCPPLKFRMSAPFAVKPASVAVKQQLDQLTGGSCSGGAKNTCRLDQQASGDGVNISNDLRNEIPSPIPASGQSIADNTLDGFMASSNFNSECNSCTDYHERLTSSTTPNTGDNSHGLEQLNGKEKEVNQPGSSVTTSVEQRSVSAEDQTEAHRREAHKTIHQNNKFLTSSSSPSSFPSSSSSDPASLSTPLEIQPNQHSVVQQISGNSEERVSLDSVAAKETISPCQENSGCGTSSAKSNCSENLRSTDTSENESQMSFFSRLPRESPEGYQPDDARLTGENSKKKVLDTLRAIEPTKGFTTKPKSNNKPPKGLFKNLIFNKPTQGMLTNLKFNNQPTNELTTELKSNKPTNELTTELKSKPTKGWPARTIPEDVFITIAEFLSREDLCNLRLVNRECSLKLQDAMFRSVVVPFTTSAFSLSETENSNAVDSESIDIFEKLGDRIYKFGMSFELDEVALLTPPRKEKSELKYSFYGSYRWHKSGYTRFDDLKKLEEAADQSNRMKKAFSKLKNATELGVVINSGYGWLNAADMSDNAIWHEEKPEVFGRRSQPNECSEAKWSIHFENAQSIAIRIMRADSPHITRRRKNYLASLTTSSYKSYRNANAQPFFHHRQGIILPGIAGRSTLSANEDITLSTLFRIYIYGKSVNHELRKTLDRTTEDPFRQFHSSSLGPITHDIPNLGNRYRTFPLIFSGINVSADVGGSTKLLTSEVSRAEGYPLRPNALTELQTEWLRETGWAAKAFMSSYICAIIDNKDVWGQVRTLNLSGISSGLLLNFDRGDLFEALPKLAALTVLVIPDWKESEAISSQDGPISTVGPERAAATFATFLGGRVGGLESLKELTVGYIGGGEHATGMFARNQHVLPAPIIKGPQPSVPKADKEGVLTFGAVAKITFKNCWFSPVLLRTFLKNSVALEEIVLESCSLTALPGGTRGHPYRGPELFPEYPEHMFYMEELRRGTWASILNRFTPGLTLEERHVMSQPDQDLVALRRPDSNLRRIELKSCGYVKLSDPDFNQNDFPMPDVRSMDYGLHSRYLDLQPFMMSHGRLSSLLGTIIQCIGDDEKHLLRVGFGMHFGWGDDLARWQCVEDGFFEGGTGRFSGILEREKAESHADEDLFGDDDSRPPLESG